MRKKSPKVERNHARKIIQNPSAHICHNFGIFRKNNADEILDSKAIGIAIQFLETLQISQATTVANQFLLKCSARVEQKMRQNAVQYVFIYFNRSVKNYWKTQ